MADTPLSTGQVAAQLGVPLWKVRRAVDSLMPETPRLGQTRMISPEAVKKLAYVLTPRQLPK